MKKKICYWLNSKQQGTLIIRPNGRIEACCTRCITLFPENTDFLNLHYRDIENKRIELFESINNNTAPQCRGCECIEDLDENCIDIGKIGVLIYHPHYTCNLKCCYCGLAQAGYTKQNFDKDKYNPLNTIKHAHKLDLLQDAFFFEFGGGEPLLLKNIPETIDFISQYYPQASVLFVSNFTLESKVNDLIQVLKNRKIKSILKTSIDCGTRKTYHKIRNKDYFDTVRKNLLNAAKAGAFDDIMLKYIFLEDGSNASKVDIEGFNKLIEEVKKNNPNQTTIVLDADQGPIFDANFQENPLNKLVIQAAAKIYFECVCKLGVNVIWQGIRITDKTPTGREYITKIQELSKEMDQLTFLQKFFSVRNEGKHKVVRIFGIKMKFKRKGS